MASLREKIEKILLNDFYPVAKEKCGLSVSYEVKTPDKILSLIHKEVLKVLPKEYTLDWDSLEMTSPSGDKYMGEYCDFANGANQMLKQVKQSIDKVFKEGV